MLMGRESYPETVEQRACEDAGHQARERIAQLMAIVVPLIFAGTFVALEIYHMCSDGQLQFETESSTGKVASTYAVAFVKSFNSYFPSTVFTLALFPVIQQCIYKVPGGFRPTNLDILAILVAIYALIYGAYIVLGSGKPFELFFLMGITVLLIVFIWCSLEDEVRHARRGWKGFAG